MALGEGYLAQLRHAMGSDLVRQYVGQRLTGSLSSIHINRSCIAAIHSLLGDIGDGGIHSVEALEAAQAAFQKSWRVHLNRSYFGDYEQVRRAYLKDLVLHDIDANIHLGRCLDLGCGRGCQTADLLSARMADTAVGIDATNFESEWNERLTQSQHPGLRFECVPADELANWSGLQESFDTILMLYMLHHSSDYWVVWTLHILRQLMHAESRLIVLEDSWSRSYPPKYDRGAIAGYWTSIGSSSEIYALTEAFHVQVVLDYVAVKLLANFSDVQMPCTYKREDEWKSIFEKCGFNINKFVYLGFPERRDIDVPQSYFVLTIR